MQMNNLKSRMTERAILRARATMKKIVLFFAALVVTACASPYEKFYQPFSLTTSAVFVPPQRHIFPLSPSDFAAFETELEDDGPPPPALVDLLASKEPRKKPLFPRFDSEFPGIFNTINQTLRNEYVLTYAPSNQARDGKVRRIKVQLINPATNEPLRINDDKGKAIKYQIVAKTGYTAPREVE